MRSIVFFCIVLFFARCSNADNTDIKSDTVIIVKASVISEIRENPNSSPVANYSVAVDDGVNNANQWKFSATLFETKSTFKFLLKMQYKELRETDTLTIPNLQVAPKVAIRKGETNQSCIIGFYDKKGVFKAYKKLIVRNEQLKLITIQSYSVRAVRSKMQ